MKKRYFISLILILLISSLAIINFIGCGAIAAIVSAIFGSQGGFVFIPFLGEKKLSESQTEKLPGMIMLYTNNPPSGYKSISGASVIIEGKTVTTADNGSFEVTGLTPGTKILKVEHPSYVAIEQEVPVSDPNSTGSSFSNFRIKPDSLLAPIGIGGTFQFSAFGDGQNGPVEPAATWSVEGDIGTVSSTGIFTATKTGTGKVKAVSGSDTASIDVTVVEGRGTVFGKVTSAGQPFSGAVVRVNNTSQYAISDGNGNYILPGTPASAVTVTATAGNGQSVSVNVTVPSDGQVEANLAFSIVIPTSTPAGTALIPTVTITPGGPTLTPTPTITPGGAILTPTPTITPGGPTLTPTPTITPGGPTLTPTPIPSKSWGGNVRVDDSSGSTSSQSPGIAVDSSGNAYSVWQDYRNGTKGDIYFSYRSTGGNWTTSSIVSLASEYTSSSRIAVDPSGNAYIVWTELLNTIPKFYFSYRPTGASWSSKVRVGNTPDAKRVGSGDIAVDKLGNAYAVWDDNRNGSSDIYFSYRPAGGSWITDVRVDDDSTGRDQNTPRIAVDSSGNAYAVWRDLREGSRDDIYFSYRPSGGNWQPNLKVNDYIGTSIYVSPPCIAVDSSGNAYCGWGDSRTGNYDAYFSYRPAGGSWSANVRVDDAYSGTFAGEPDIAVDILGNTYAIWTDDRNGSKDIYFSIRQ